MHQASKCSNKAPFFCSFCFSHHYYRKETQSDFEVQLCSGNHNGSHYYISNTNPVKQCAFCYKTKKIKKKKIMLIHNIDIKKLKKHRVCFFFLNLPAYVKTKKNFGDKTSSVHCLAELICQHGRTGYTSCSFHNCGCFPAHNASWSQNDLFSEVSHYNSQKLELTGHHSQNKTSSILPSHEDISQQYVSNCFFIWKKFQSAQPYNPFSGTDRQQVQTTFLVPY